MDRRRAVAAFSVLLAAGGTALSRVTFAQSTTKTIGYLSARSSTAEQEFLAAIRRGLGETGNIEGRNLAIEYRWADGNYERLMALADQLARRRVSLMITTGGPQPARAARAAAPSTPIVFVSGSDPVADGLVGNLNRPDGITTGVVVFTTSLGPKRLELLRELLPGQTVIAFLVNPHSDIAAMQVRDIEKSAQAVSQPLQVVYAGSAPEIDTAFSGLSRRGIGGLLISADLFFQIQRQQLVELAARHAMPTMYEWPEFVLAGGLISYSTNRIEAWHQLGLYAGQILNGVKPAQLPIVRSTKFEMVINLKTARALRLTIPPSILLRADRVIE